MVVLLVTLVTKFCIPAAFLVFVVRIKRTLYVYELLELGDRQAKAVLPRVGSQNTACTSTIDATRGFNPDCSFLSRAHCFFTPLSFLLRAPI